jgi:hypothetical protein
MIFSPMYHEFNFSFMNPDVWVQYQGYSPLQRSPEIHESDDRDCFIGFSFIYPKCLPDNRRTDSKQQAMSTYEIHGEDTVVCS